mmetsp:Transcript_10526/g.31007  ORF Transcript_10526/g.31007 Transcript_10526/m.31007 type:complete len:98 (+) Transcript_10526:1090-1383(+)
MCPGLIKDDKTEHCHPHVSVAWSLECKIMAKGLKHVWEHSRVHWQRFHAHILCHDVATNSESLVCKNQAKCAPCHINTFLAPLTNTIPVLSCLSLSL